MKRVFSFVFVLSLALGLAGCAFLVIASVGAVGGYAVTSDSIQGEYDVTSADAFRASVETCGALGYVTVKDTANGTLEAMVDRAKVNIWVTRLTPEAIRLKVKARKGIFPRRAVAEKVFVKIVQQLM